MMAKFPKTRLLDPSAPDYPSALPLGCGREGSFGERWREPPAVYVRGPLPELPVVAIVGTRDPCLEAVRWTRELVAVVGEAGWAIGSGGAEGIDEVAHRAALGMGVPTLVAVAGGLAHPEDARLERLLEDVLLAGGCAVSLDPDGTVRGRPDFFRRNQLLVALSFGVVAVELRSKPGQGGTGHTARSALALGRTVLTVAHPPWSRGGAATAALVDLGVAVAESADGAVRRLREGLERGTDSPATRPAHRTRPRRPRTGPKPEVPQARLFEPAADPNQRDAPLDLDLGEDARLLAMQLDGTPKHLDALVLATGLDATRALRGMLECCLGGAARETTPGRYVAAPARRVASS